MPTGTNVTITMTPTDPTAVCCGTCAGLVPKVLHLSNDFAFFAVTHDPLNLWWRGNFLAAGVTVAAAQPDPTGRPGFGPTPPCQKPKDEDATDSLPITATLLCPDTPGAPWRLYYTAKAEGTFFRFLGVTMAAHNCNANGSPGFPVRTVTSPVTLSGSPGCETMQTFPAPASPWTDSFFHNYTAVPHVGDTIMST